MSENIDYLIIGQGLCGTFLSYFLLKKGKKVLVIDEQKLSTASKVASGVINPVTGRRIVTTWRIEELLPFAVSAYSLLGKEFQKKLIAQCDIIDFHPSPQMKEAFLNRLSQQPEYLYETSEKDWTEYFNFFFGAGKISPCLLIDISTLLSQWRDQLIKGEALLQETFDIKSCTIHENYITYNNMTASKIIFCDGVQSAVNPYFKNLPFSLNKGEAVIVSIPGLSSQFIYKQGISIVPWKNQLFWVGSGYDWNFTDDLPTASFKDKITFQLKNFLKLPFEVVDHLAALRPANLERRPFVGLHPVYKNVGILNGMGTKGCSLAPFFAKQMADFLVSNQPPDPEVDVKRFTRVLSRLQ